MDKSREQFEDWYKCDAFNRVKWYQESNVRSDLMVDSDGYYLRDAIQRRWEAWQASRAAIEIELPPLMKIEEPGISFCAYGRAGVLNSIYEQGLKVKE